MEGVREVPAFPQMHVPAPKKEQLEALGASLAAQLRCCRTPQQKLKVFQTFEGHRRNLSTWSSLVHIRFNQDTRNEEFVRQRALHDALKPLLLALLVEFERLLCAEDNREVFEKTFGSYLVARWQAHAASFQQEMAPELLAEAETQAAYTKLLGDAQVGFRDRTYTLAELAKYTEVADRGTRYEAHNAKWRWFATQREVLDGLFFRLVELRTAMARKAGFENFIPLGYLRMCRTDFGPQEAAHFRAAVLRHVVPLVRKLKEAQRAALGYDRLFFWDEPLLLPEGNPTPTPARNGVVEATQSMLDSFSCEFGDLLRLMNQKSLLDLKPRPGKSAGGFCSSLPQWGVPFVFANFNNTRQDVEVFTHEMGHAYACWVARTTEPLDYRSPTAELCEIHSMGLEFLTWPWMGLFFSDREEAFRRLHLTRRISFLPYCAAIDEFQHAVYETPSLTARERLAVWRDCEARYLPWRAYGDLPAVSEGRLWQAQRHVYLWPFYYLDYGLALSCAVQLLRMAQQSWPEAYERYLEIVRRAGRSSFLNVLSDVGLTSPFDDSLLRELCAYAAEVLEVTQ